MNPVAVVLDQSSVFATALAGRDEALCWLWPPAESIGRYAAVLPWRLSCWTVSVRGDRSRALWRRLVAHRRRGELVGELEIAVGDDEAVLEICRLSPEVRDPLPGRDSWGYVFGLLASESDSWSADVLEATAAYARAHCARPVAVGEHLALRSRLLEARVSPALIATDADVIEVPVFPVRREWSAWAAVGVGPTLEFERWMRRAVHFNALRAPAPGGE